MSNFGGNPMSDAFASDGGIAKRNSSTSSQGDGVLDRHELILGKYLGGEDSFRTCAIYYP